MAENPSTLTDPNQENAPVSTTTLLILGIGIFIVIAVVVYIILTRYKHYSVRTEHFRPKDNTLTNIMSERQRLFSTQDVL
jgi:hypothetical protein